MEVRPGRLTDLGTQLGHGRSSSTAPSTLPRHGWYPQPQDDLEFITLDGRRKSNSCLPTLSWFLESKERQPPFQSQRTTLSGGETPVLWNAQEAGCGPRAHPEVRVALHGATRPCL